MYQNPEFVQIWDQVEKKLSYLFRTAADICQKKEQITLDKRNRYFVSGTQLFNLLFKLFHSVDFYN